MKEVAEALLMVTGMLEAVSIRLVTSSCSQNAWNVNKYRKTKVKTLII